MDAEKINYLIASRIYQDILSYMERMMQISTSLAKSPNLTMIQTRRFLRANRNSSYLRQSHHFTTMAVLGSGHYGSVELVHASYKPEKYYAIKTVYVKRAEKRARYQRMAQAERDVAILGFDCPFVMRYKAVWMECNQTGKPDSFKFLMPVMSIGNLKTVIKQLHPFVKHQVPFTFCDMTDANLQVPQNDPLYKLKMEVRALREYGRDQRFTRIYTRYMMQMFNGIRFLHYAGVVHHDVKPENYLVDNNLDLKLADYGHCSSADYQQLYEFTYWAKPPTSSHVPAPSNRKDLGALSPVNLREVALSHQRGASGVMEWGGTKHYMAPEQCREWYIDPLHQDRQFPTYSHYSIDWYAIGMTLFQLVTGKDIFLLSLSAFPYCVPVHTHDGRVINKYTRARWMKMHDDLVPFLNATHEIQNDLETFIVDIRLFDVIRELLRTEPNLRLSDLSANQNASVCSLSEGVPLTGPPEWQFNEFYGAHFPDPIISAVNDYLDKFVAGEEPREVPEEHTAIPHISNFPFMTGSPEVIAWPEMSPTKKMRTRFEYEDAI